VEGRRLCQCDGHEKERTRVELLDDKFQLPVHVGLIVSKEAAKHFLHALQQHRKAGTKRMIVVKDNYNYNYNFLRTVTTQYQKTKRHSPSFFYTVLRALMAIGTHPESLSCL